MFPYRLSNISLLRKAIISVFLLAYATSSSFAQTDIANQHNTWYSLKLSYKFNPKWSINGTHQFRRNGWIENPQHYFFNLNTSYKASNAHIFNAGMIFINHIPYGKQPNRYSFFEYRPFAQYTFSKKIGQFTLANRSRLALRMNESKTYRGNAAGYQYTSLAKMPWLRNKIGFKIPLEPDRLYWHASEEAFVGFGKNAPSNNWVQNRIVTGLSYTFNSKHKIALNYMLQHINKADGIRSERNHTLFIGYSATIETKKNK